MCLDGGEGIIIAQDDPTEQELKKIGDSLLEAWASP